MIKQILIQLAGALFGIPILISLVIKAIFKGWNKVFYVITRSTTPSILQVKCLKLCFFLHDWMIYSEMVILLECEKNLEHTYDKNGST